MTPVHIKLFHVALLTYAVGIVLSVVLTAGRPASVSFAGNSAPPVDCAKLASVSATPTVQQVDCPDVNIIVQDAPAELAPPLSEPL